MNNNNMDIKMNNETVIIAGIEIDKDVAYRCMKTVSAEREPYIYAGDLNASEQAHREAVMSKSGRLIEIRVNGALLASLRTDWAVAADYINFMQAFADAMMDKAVLEKEAEQSGKTIMHGLFETLGSLPIKDPKGL